MSATTPCTEYGPACKKLKATALDTEQGPQKAAMTQLLGVLDLNPVTNWSIWSYKLARWLFGATCKACHVRVQRADIGQRWFHQCCPFIPASLRCRFCAGTISGLLFWQDNGVVHYGCVDKGKAHDKMAPAQEETFMALRWGPDWK